MNLATLECALRGDRRLVFCVTAVIFEDHKSIEACAKAIKELRTKLGFDPSHEFKFSKCSRKVRMAFLEAIAPFVFCYHSLVLNKAKLTGPGFYDKSSHYKFAINLLFQNAMPLLKDAKVVFDKCGGREFTDQLKNYLRRKVIGKDGKCPIRKFSPEDSHRNDLVQMADMVCGAIARSFRNDKADKNDYRVLVKKHEVRVQFWPG